MIFQVLRKYSKMIYILCAINLISKSNFTNLSPVPIISRACGTDMAFTTDRLCPLLEQCTYSLILAAVPL